MNAVLREAHKILFGAEPVAGLEDWQVAKKIMEKFNIPKLGENLAWQCCYQISNVVTFPDDDTRVWNVARAEAFASELCLYLGDEPHMADIARWEYKRQKGKDIFNRT